MCEKDQRGRGGPEERAMTLDLNVRVKKKGRDLDQKA